MALNKKPYKGTRDFFPADMRVREFLFNEMKRTAHLFGLEPYDGPMLEEVELYKAKSGEELINDQIYSFTDRGERFVAIRPEMTPTVARMVAAVHKEIPRPIRWYSIPNLMRYEKPQRGRLREHWQFNCDIFGAPEGHGELEIIQLAIQLFKNYGATEAQFSIHLNDRKIVDFVFNDLLSLNGEQSYKLYKIIDKSKKVTPQKLEKMLTDFGLTGDSLKTFKNYLSLDSFEKLTQFINQHEKLKADAASFLYLIESSSKLGLLEYLEYDASIVRGLDYYTGLVFEIFDKHPDNRRALCGGGAYANLLQIFGEDPLPGVGFGLGDVTLRDFLEVHKLLPDLTKASSDIYLFTTEEAGLETIYQLAAKLRELGVSVVCHLKEIKFKKILSLTEKKGSSFAGIIGDQELASNSIQIRNMEERNNQSFPLSDLQTITNFLKK